VGLMQQPTIRQLYAYWDRMRNGRTAPRRFEIQPADIAALLPETFIAERMAGRGLRFRLAGTKICENFGRELRGTDFLTFWETEDRAALASLLRNVFADAAVGHGTFRAFAQADREASFEFLLLPLIHNGDTINRLLGAIVAIDPAFWLGTQPSCATRSWTSNCTGPTASLPLSRRAALRSYASAPGASASSMAVSPRANKTPTDNSQLPCTLRRSLTEKLLPCASRALSTRRTDAGRTQGNAQNERTQS
jgi:hypothetical protein